MFLIRQPQLLHELFFLGDLAEFGFPVFAHAGEFGCEGGGMAGEAFGLGGGFLGRVYVFRAVEEPLMARAAE